MPAAGKECGAPWSPWGFGKSPFPLTEAEPGSGWGCAPAVETGDNKGPLSFSSLILEGMVLTSSGSAALEEQRGWSSAAG